jgi:transcriptional regulator with XRE-family HTH domain
MSQPTAGHTRLAMRLRELRSDWSGTTQRHLAQALGASGALVSSWENGNAVPPEDRIAQYARFFATRRSVASMPARLLDDLDRDEEQCRIDLETELLRLRLDGAGPAERRATGSLGGRFWYFPDGQPVTIICTRMSIRQMVGDRRDELEAAGGVPDSSYAPIQQYTLNPEHPNAVYNARNGDIDALLELVGHVRAENPATSVSWLMTDAPLGPDDLLGHVVVLGGGDALNKENEGAPREFRELLDRLDLPVRSGAVENEDEEFDFSYEVFDEPTNPDGSATSFYPDLVSVPTSAVPRLQQDLALIVRRPNPFNESATVTVCAGIFSRGTYGAVRAFTDGNLRTRNEKSLEERVDPASFWMLVRVPVFAGRRTMPPDLANPDHVVRSS